MSLILIHDKALRDAANAITDDEIKKVRKEILEALGDRIKSEDISLMFSDVFGLLARSESALLKQHDT